LRGLGDLAGLDERKTLEKGFFLGVKGVFDRKIVIFGVFWGDFDIKMVVFDIKMVVFDIKMVVLI
jgi:hypothetical protein